MEVLVCREGEIADGGVRLVKAARVEIGVIRHKGQVLRLPQPLPASGRAGLRRRRACRRWSTCIGEGGIYLGQSFDEDDMHIVCPWHGYEFHLSDGCHVVDRRLRLKKYDVVQRDGEIYVAV